MTLKQRTFSAGRWTAMSALIRTGLQVVQMAILARLLLPSDFGLMAIVVSMLAVLSLFSDLGVSRAIIHFESISNDALASLYWLNLSLGMALSLLFALSAPLAGILFGIHGLTPVLLATSPVLALSAIGQQFRTLAEKELLFSQVGIIEITSTGLGFTTAVITAELGGGVYALVGAALMTAATGSILAWWKLSKGHRPRMHFRMTEVRPFVRFGSYLVGEGFANALRFQSDVLIAGLMVNPSALGLFSVTRDLSVRIGMVVNPIITRVGFPVMSRLQNDMASLKSVYLHTLRMTASVNFPVYVALALFSDEIVALLYGPQWKDAAVYLRLLAAWGMLRSVGNPVGSLLHATGAVKRAFLWNSALLMAVPLLYWITIDARGLMGLAVALVALQAVLTFPSWLFLVRPSCGANLGEYISQLSTPLLVSLVSGFVAWCATLSLSYGILRLTIGGLVGGLTYAAISWKFNKPWRDAMLELLRFSRS